MITKNYEAIGRMIERLQTILDTDHKLSRYEKDCIADSIQSLKYVVEEDDATIFYTSRLADDTD